MSIRVLVVDDSLTVRKRIVDILSAAEGFEVVGEAGDGRAAIELCQRLRPSVVTMDMMLPIMTGLSATEYIMAYCPTPILIVSASTNRGELFKTYDALAAGAVDVLEKPIGSEPAGDWDRQLLAALRIVSRVSVITHPRAKLGRHGRPPVDAQKVREIAAAVDSQPGIIAIGASTGGPGAILSVLRCLPARFPVPILLVIHISEPFGLAMAEWLDAQTGIPVRYARDGEAVPGPERGGVLMAPPDWHLEVRGGRLRLTASPERHSCRPSVDVLFESLAHERAKSTIACLLTGMGRDGAQGLLAIKNAGGRTVAQDEATSVIFGMPGEAVRIGAAHHVLGLPEIGPFLIRVSAESPKGAGRR